MFNTKSKTFIPTIIMLVAALVMCISLFIPYISVPSDQAAALKVFGLGKLANISIMGYSGVVDDLGGEDAEIYAALSVVMLVASIATLAFAFLKKFMPTIIADVVAIAAFALWTLDFAERKVFSGDAAYNISAGFFFFIIGAVGVIVGAVMFKAAQKADIDAE